jgi:DNA-binding ferritin-like protein (Dps family)
MMTPRQRYNAIMDHSKPDRIPWAEWFDSETLWRWVYAGKINPGLIRTRPGCQGGGAFLITVDYPLFISDFPTETFGCMSTPGLFFTNDKGPIPRYMIKLVSNAENYYEVRADTGVNLRHTKHGDFSWYKMPMYTDWPVRDRKTWAEYKKRFDPTDVRRMPKDWNPSDYEELFKSFQWGPTRISFNGLYGFGAQIMGIEEWNIVFFKDPDLAHEIADFWEYFTIELFRPALDVIGKYVDTTWWWEDFAERHGPFVSRRTFEKFFLAHYKKVAEFLHKKGVSHIMIDSDGNFESILDMLVEAGIDGLWPLEVNASMDVGKLRDKYGKKLWFGGNIDKREVIVGGDRMKKEVDRKLEIAEQGGYSPGLDHLVPAEMSYESFLNYAEYVKKKLGL